MMQSLSIDPAPLLLTLELAAVTTTILFVLGLPLAHWLAFTRNRWKPMAEALVSMPLVLPPTVLGFYLLLLFSPGRYPGRWMDEVLHLRLVFNFPGLVAGSVIFSLPFMVHPLQAGFLGVPESLMEASYTLGKSHLQTLLRVVFPMMKASMLAGVVMTFAHTVGEFGVVLMMGGNIDGVTKVASIAIYDEVEALNYTAAGIYSSILFFISFAILILVYTVNKKSIRTM